MRFLLNKQINSWDGDECTGAIQVWKGHEAKQVWNDI